MPDGTSEEAEQSAAHECEFELLLWEEDLARLEERIRQWDDLLIPVQRNVRKRWWALRRRPGGH